MTDKPSTTAGTFEEWAKLFHETYERLAPSFGYETRKASAVPWEHVPEKNRKLMIAVCTEVLNAAIAAKDAEIAAAEEAIYNEAPAPLSIEVLNDYNWNATSHAQFHKEYFEWWSRAKLGALARHGREIRRAALEPLLMIIRYTRHWEKCSQETESERNIACACGLTQLKAHALHLLDAEAPKEDKREPQ